MNGNYLLDSNAIIDFFRGKNSFLVDLIQNQSVFVFVIVIGELFYGAENAVQINKHLSQINEFVSKITIVEVNFETSKIYGKIRANLKKQGTPIPENDIWIAAIAVQNNYTLVTND
jgi:tRNA(fMet)-specific endonuclease VapC